MHLVFLIVNTRFGWGDEHDDGNCPILFFAGIQAHGGIHAG